MKKLLGITLALLITIVFVAGCGSSSEEDDYCEKVCDNFKNCSMPGFDVDGCKDLCYQYEDTYSDACKQCVTVTDCTAGWLCVTSNCEGFGG